MTFPFAKIVGLWRKLWGALRHQTFGSCEDGH